MAKSWMAKSWMKAWMVKSSQTKSLTLKRVRARITSPPDVPDSRGFQAFCGIKSQSFSALPQGLVNHAGRYGAGDHGLTSLFKPKRKRLG
jgi:hypothetical protein